MKKLFVTLVLVIASFTLFGQEITCNKCGGSGVIIEDVYKTCPDCRGAKERIIEITKNCPQCNGTTRMKVPDGNGNLKSVPCNYSYCNNGKVKEKRTERCGKCGGTGGHYVSERKTCPKCNGRGKVYR